MHLDHLLLPLLLLLLRAGHVWAVLPALIVQCGGPALLAMAAVTRIKLQVRAL